MQFTVEEAIEYANQNSLLEWIMSYLAADGYNLDLARGIQLQHNQISFLGPKLYPIETMEYYCGKPGTECRSNRPPGWVDQMCQSLDQGWAPPPLILTPKTTTVLSSSMVRDSRYILLDGNHRKKALEKRGYQEYWAINCFGLRLN